ncbi:MAG: murein biosynthesis protein MurJ, partial [Cellulomonadaceae bacterium]|nr:murein biosynthesis protein MurJ [Cellulomonadaceae bacterium]
MSPRHARSHHVSKPVAVPDAKSLGRNSLTLTIGTFASRATGLVRTMLLVAAIGIEGSVADAFDIANTLPNMLFTLLAAGVLQAVLMPQIMQAIRAHNTQERLDKLLTVAAATLLGFTVVLVAATPLLIRLFTLAGDVSPLALSLAIAFGFWCVPQVFFYGLFSLISEVLSARGQFMAVGWAPVANNIVSIAGFGAFVLTYGVAGAPINDLTAWTWTQTALMGGTATLGIIAQAAILLIALRRGGFRWNIRFGLHGIGLRSASKVIGWTIAAVALEQVGLVYLRNNTLAAGQLGAAEGVAVAGPAAFTNALTIYILPHSLVVVSIITALFPRMSMAAASGDVDGVRDAMSLGLRSAGVFSVIASAIIFVLAEPIMKSLLPSVSATGIVNAAPVLRALSLGLVALGATVMVKRMYFAFGDGRGIFVIQIFATAATVGIIWLATRALSFDTWTIAAAAAYALAAWVSVLLRVGGMRKKLNGSIDGRRVAWLYVRCGIAALVAAVVGLVIGLEMGAFGGTASWSRAVLTAAVGGAAMLAVYFVGIKVLRVRELDAALAPIVR